MIVKCIRRCWDARRGMRYHIGMEADIDPLEPIAGNFSFPPGTEVYWKKPGSKTEPAISTTRIVPGMVEEKKRLFDLDKEEENLKRRLAEIERAKAPLREKILETEKSESEVVCDICGEYHGTDKQVRMHRLHCNGKKE